MIDMKRLTLFLLLMMSVMLAVAQRNVTGTVIEGDTKEPMARMTQLPFQTMPTFSIILILIVGILSLVMQSETVLSTV